MVVTVYFKAVYCEEEYNMVCSKCGMKANEGENICSNCKIPLQPVKYEFDMPLSELFNMANKNTDEITIVKSKSKVLKPLIIIPIVLCITAVLSVLLVTLKSSYEKKQSEYIAGRTFTLGTDELSFRFYGFDGYGTLKVSVDEQSFYQVIMPALDFKENNEETKSVMDDIMKQVKIELSEDSNLSNGQQITIHIDIDEECLKKYDIYFEEVQFLYDIDELKKMEAVDIFENLYIESYKVGNSYKVQWEYFGDNSVFVDRSITCSPPDKLSYGDSFVLSLDRDNAETLKTKYGMNPLEFEKEYVLVENKTEYLKEFEDISDKLISRVTRRDITALQNMGKVKDINCENCEYVAGMLFYMESFDFSPENYMVLIYKTTNSYDDISEDRYFWISYMGVVQNSYGMQKLKYNDASDDRVTYYYEYEVMVSKENNLQYVTDEILSMFDLSRASVSFDSKLKGYFD